MKNQDRRVNGWAQTSLLPPEHLEIVLTVHLSVAATSAQVGIRIRDHGEDVLLGMYVGKAPMSPENADVIELVTDLFEAALREHLATF